jgi:hypothetical protein
MAPRTEGAAWIRGPKFETPLAARNQATLSGGKFKRGNISDSDSDGDDDAAAVGSAKAVVVSPPSRIKESVGGASRGKTSSSATKGASANANASTGAAGDGGAVRKGVCGECGKGVFGNEPRAKAGGVYYHKACRAAMQQEDATNGDTKRAKLGP